MTRAPDEIWAGDLFNRREEANQLIAYIESVVASPFDREDKKAYTIAIDGQYGEGKSFFLRRLAEALSSDHPVAFIDAWADDLADEPLTALAATLKQAMEPFVAQPAIASRMQDFMRKTGKVAKIVSWGLLRRGVGLLLTTKAVDAAEDIISDMAEDVQDAIDDGLKDIGTGTAEDAGKALSSALSHSEMEKRVTAFEQGKAAVEAMKASLRAVVASLAFVDRHRPIVIVIDELDRCRPTYAVKLLEEIKHLFDVQGIVFILATHRQQLNHSIRGVYGAGFDGQAYLRRFIDREYRLRSPELASLLTVLCERTGLLSARFAYPKIAARGDSLQFAEQTALPNLLALYMKVYGLAPRDAFTLVDMLQTAAAVAGPHELHLAYLVPLIIGHIKGKDEGDLPDHVTATNLVFLHIRRGGRGESEEISLWDAATKMQVLAGTSTEQLETMQNRDTRQWGVTAVLTSRGHNQPLAAVESYPRLLREVARFSNPNLRKDESKA